MIRILKLNRDIKRLEKYANQVNHVQYVGTEILNSLLEDREDIAKQAYSVLNKNEKEDLFWLIASDYKSKLEELVELQELMEELDIDYE